MLSYDFMRRAFIVAILISVTTPLIGNIIVLKRLSPVGDSISHSCIAGVAIGLCFGFNPILGAIIAAIAAAFGIEFFRRVFSKYSELSTSIVMAIGVGLAGIFTSITNSSANLNSFLFGSIVAITDQEFIFNIVLSIVVIVAFLFMYNDLFHIAFDEQDAIISGVPVKRVNFIFTVLLAIVVAISTRTVGALMISSLLVLPVACAMQVSSSFKSNIIYSVAFAMFFTICGLIISYIFNLSSGGTIVLLGVAVLLVIITVKRKVHIK